jgi:hypothetical protein
MHKNFGTGRHPWRCRGPGQAYSGCSCMSSCALTWSSRWSHSRNIYKKPCSEQLAKYPADFLIASLAERSAVPHWDRSREVHPGSRDWFSKMPHQTAPFSLWRVQGNVFSRKVSPLQIGRVLQTMSSWHCKACGHKNLSSTCPWVLCPSMCSLVRIKGCMHIYCMS